MEAATTKRGAPDAQKRASDVSIKLGALMLRCLSGAGGEAFRVIDESGLTFGQLKALVELERPETRGTVTALAEDLGVSAASASRAADGLVRKKLATRIEDPDDRRVRRLALTDTGRELAERVISARLAGLEEFTRSLEPDERKKLEATLDALLARPELAEIYASYERRVRK
jgi:DNA-binding MarR family transcriptional regulator